MQPPAKALSGGGRLLTGLAGLLFAALGLLFTFLLLADAWKILQTYRWQETPCQVQSCNIIRDEVGAAKIQLEYSYHFQNQPFASSQLHLRPRSFSNYSQAQRLADRFPPGSSATCLVNPRSPSESILLRTSLASAFSVFFPLLFVALGAWLLKRSLSSYRPHAAENQPQFLPSRSRLGPLLFFGIFFAFGLGFSYWLLLRPALKIFQARHWTITSCTILESVVRSSTSDDGVTYRPDVLYSYISNGKEYRSNRYHFIGGSSSGYAAKQLVVDRYPQGSQQVCYVNPSDPYESVLKPGPIPEMWFGTIPLLFLIVGVGGLTYTLRRGPTSNAAEPSTLASAPGGELILKPQHSPAWRFVGCTFLALFWNGIVSVFLVEIISGWRRGNPDWFHTIFLTPFVIIGLLFIGATFISFGELFLSRPRLRISKNPVPTGSSFDLHWQFPSRIPASISFTLLGAKLTTTSDSDSTSTDTDEFYKEEIFHATHPLDVRSGNVQVTVPLKTPATYKLGNVEVRWSIRMETRRHFWFKSLEEYPFTVIQSYPETT